MPRLQTSTRAYEPQGKTGERCEKHDSRATRVAADPGHRCDERGTVAAEDACHAACYAQELKNLKRETWSAKQPLRAP